MSEADTSDMSVGPLMLSVADESLQVSIGESSYSISTLLLAGVFVAFVALPAVVSGYFIRLLVLGLILAIFAMSVDLVWGYAGILTFGHAAFYGLGAYLMAVITTNLSVPSIGIIGLVLAFIIPTIVGGIIAGILFFRGISEEYFTIITLALAIVANQIALIWGSVTGGSNGLTGIPPLGIEIPGVFAYTVPSNLFYFVVLAVLLSVYLISRRVIHSPFGTALSGINQNEAKMSSLGYDPVVYKTLIFAISTGIAGFAGALYAASSGFVSPPVLGFVLSTEVLIWVLIGGRGTLLGPIIGAVALTLAENILSGAFLSSWVLLLGIALVVIVLVFPTGIAGVFSIIEQKIIDRIERKEST